MEIVAPLVVFISPETGGCPPISGSRLRWIEQREWSSTGACGAAAWLPRGLDGAVQVLSRTRAAMPPDLPLVAISEREPSPQECFHLLGNRADFVMSRAPAWTDIVEDLLGGRARGVASVYEFCERNQLSRRESETVFTACAGLSKVEAYEVLGCSPRTLETYWSRVFSKVGIRSTTGVVAAVLRTALRGFALVD
jgi:DNA-binding CsgD family transcriptional regulator